jgi:GxxExxY protein
LYCDNQVLNQSYRTDFICFGKIIIELKAAKDLNENHYAQIINYLKGTGMRLGLWVNFGSYPQVTMKRFAH